MAPQDIINFTMLRLTKANKGYTLTEMLVVIIIVGILAALALVNYTKSKEQTIDKEAKANLKLVQAAQKIYRMENTFYYPNTGSAATGAINTDLRLSLPTGTNPNWNYTTNATTPGQAVATRNKAGGRAWTLPVANDDPTCANGGSDNCL